MLTLPPKMRKQTVLMKGYYLNVLLGDPGLGDSVGSSEDHHPGGAAMEAVLGEAPMCGRAPGINATWDKAMTTLGFNFPPVPAQS